MYVAGRLLFKKLYKEVTGLSVLSCDIEAEYRKAFIKSIEHGVKEDLFVAEMLSFDVERLAEQLVLDRDFLFDYMGLRTLYERYFMRSELFGIFELPQIFWMRVAMGLALNEENKDDRAIEFYTA